MDELSEKNTKLQQKKQIIQKILSNKSVGIAGAGGLGSNVAIALARSGVKKFILVDFDWIEKSNLNRQYYFLSQLNQLKVEALQDNIHQIDPTIDCKIFSQRLENGSMEEPFTNVDVAVEALDTAETKTQFIEEIITHLPNTPLVAASGVAGIGHSDRIKTIRSGNLYLVHDEHALSSDEDVLLAPKVCLMANWQANLVLEILLGDHQWE